MTSDEAFEKWTQSGAEVSIKGAWDAALEHASAMERKPVLREVHLKTIKEIIEHFWKVEAADEDCLFERETAIEQCQELADKAVAETVERILALDFYDEDSIRSLSPDPNFVERERLKARLEEAKRIEKAWENYTGELPPEPARKVLEELERRLQEASREEGGGDKNGTPR